MHRPPRHLAIAEPRPAALRSPAPPHRARVLADDAAQEAPPILGGLLLLLLLPLQARRRRIQGRWGAVPWVVGAVVHVALGQQHRHLGRRRRRRLWGGSGPGEASSQPVAVLPQACVQKPTSSPLALQ